MMERRPLPSEAAEKFVVRLLDGMRDRIRREAKENVRSMNSEIVFPLRKALGVAAGGELGQDTPAAEDDEAALGERLHLTRQTRTHLND